MKKIEFIKEDGKEIHPNFTPELQVEGQSKGFDYQGTKEGIDVGLQINDASYAQGLSIVKNKDPKWFLDHSHEKKGKKEFIENENGTGKLEELVFNKFKKGEVTFDKFLFFACGRLLNKELNPRENGLLCQECQQPATETNWCQSCNSKRFQQEFENGTSGNQEIDELIKECQLQATTPNEVLEGIPYEQFTEIEYIDDGGFGRVYRAKGNNGSIKCWNLVDKQ